MDPAGFERTFGGLIRARLDWSRLRALAASGRVEVADEVVLDRHRLATLHTVWYMDGSGAPTDHHRPGAVNLRVGQAAELASGEPLIAGWEARGKRLVELQTSLRASGGPVVLALPAYRIGGGRALLLDGTHRVVAAVGARLPVRTVLFTLHGPLDPEILPDLRHHRPASTAGGRGDG